MMSRSRVIGFGGCIPAVLLLAVGLLPSGCDTSSSAGGGTGSANGGDGGSQTGEGSIPGLQTDRTISGDQMLTIPYVVPSSATSVQAFYVEGEQVTNGALAQSAQLVFYSNVLLAGSSSFDIQTGDMPRGMFYVGIRYLDGNGATKTILSQGRLILQGLANPLFIEPSQNVTVGVGGSVQVIVDLRDPEGEVDWRLFFVSEATAPADPSTLSGAQLAQLGTEITPPGSGNAINADWLISNVAVGTYVVGVSATDSGFSIADTALAGDTEKIVTIYNEFTVTVGSGAGNDNANPFAPTVTVSAPASDKAIFGTEDIDVAFSAETFEGTQNDVEVFYDNDAVFSNGVLGVVATGLTTADTSASVSSAALDEGSYRFGVSVDDGLNDVVAAYAPGTVSIINNPTLTVTQPATTTVVKPTESVNIAWTTNVPSSAATTQVTATRSGDASATPIDIAVGEGNSATWSPNVSSGIYNISVRLIFNDPTVEDLLATAPGAVRVSTAPEILWVGCFGDASDRPAECPDPGELPPGAILEGVQFEDNLGTASSPAGDLDADGNDDFVIVARYGKPFFSNPDGIGHGEAYLVYGDSDRLNGEININSLGTQSLTGVTFAGIRTPQGNSETDGLADVLSIPDVDDDNRPELVFGFPSTKSRGHNVDERQDGVVDPRTLITLEREDQFLRGGIVIVSSMNEILRNPGAGGQSPVINLDVVGQDFDETTVAPPQEDLGDDEASDLVGSTVDLDEFRTGFVDNVIDFDSDGLTCEGNCDDPATDDDPDANRTLRFGFARALARDYFATYVYDAGLLDEFSNEFVDGAFTCGLVYCIELPPTCEPFSPGLHDAYDSLFNEFEPFVNFPSFSYPVYGRRSGFYLPFTDIRGEFELNQAKEPFGARIIGVGLEDKFGSNLALSAESAGGAGSLIVTAPERTARGILMGPVPGGCSSPPECGGEIDGLESSPGSAKTNTDSGVAYIFELRSLWTPFDDPNTSIARTYPPRPHQYIVGEASHSCGGVLPMIDNIDAVRIAGDSNEKINNIVTIPDFNDDGRDDFAVGSPESDRVYVAFRRDPGVEGDYVLEKLELAVSDPERLSGALITGTPSSEFGVSMGADVDLNGDDVPDLVIGAPNANSGIGEIVVIFADPSLISGAGGVNIETLIAQGRAAKISGYADEAGLFGYNVASGGDIDGDGKDDLLVSAPGASPRYDSNPNDADDTLDAFGLDIDGDGVKDDVTGVTPGSYGRPDGQLTVEDNLAKAGLVYVIWGSNVIEGTQSISTLGAGSLDGAIIVGRRAGDYFGGGDAGEVTMGGINAKKDRGRSRGLGRAGDVDSDGRSDLLIGSVLASPRVDPQTGEATTHGGEVYLIYGFDR